MTAIMKHIRTLLPHELLKYREHLLRLNPEDRRLRFGFPITDEGIRAFVDGLTWRKDRILVHHSPAMRVVGAAHLAIEDRETAEMAFSVEAPYRCQGLARELFHRGLLAAGNRNVRSVCLHFLAENGSMRHLARETGMDIHLESGECEAILAAPPATPQSVFAELTAEAQAQTDYLKRMNRRVMIRPSLAIRPA